jgi:hypothetical protein
MLRLRQYGSTLYMVVDHHAHPTLFTDRTQEPLSIGDSKTVNGKKAGTGGKFHY